MIAWGKDWFGDFKPYFDAIVDRNKNEFGWWLKEKMIASQTGNINDLFRHPDYNRKEISTPETLWKDARRAGFE